MTKDVGNVLQVLPVPSPHLSVEFRYKGSKSKVSRSVMALAFVEYRDGRRQVEPLFAWPEAADGRFYRPCEVTDGEVRLIESNAWNWRGRTTLDSKSFAERN